jgi:hypothetical protein
MSVSTLMVRHRRTSQCIGLEPALLTPAGDRERSSGAPAKLARAIFDTTRLSQPPLRLTLGADAYDMIHDALKARLDRLESQEALAHSMAFVG